MIISKISRNVFTFRKQRNWFKGIFPLLYLMHGDFPLPYCCTSYKSRFFCWRFKFDFTKLDQNKVKYVSAPPTSSYESKECFNSSKAEIALPLWKVVLKSKIAAMRNKIFKKPFLFCYFLLRHRCYQKLLDILKRLW